MKYFAVPKVVPVAECMYCSQVLVLLEDIETYWTHLNGGFACNPDLLKEEFKL
jgi:hypothetical protein